MRFKFVRLEALDPQKLYKVTQLVIDGKEEMYFVEDGYGRHHADILAEILKTHSLPLAMKKKFSSTDKGFILQGEDFTVNGMGGAKLLKENHVILFGNSVGFEINISESHAGRFFLGKKGWRYTAPPLPGLRTA